MRQLSWSEAGWQRPVPLSELAHGVAVAHSGRDEAPALLAPKLGDPAILKKAAIDFWEISI